MTRKVGGARSPAIVFRTSELYDSGMTANPFADYLSTAAFAKLHGCSQRLVQMWLKRPDGLPSIAAPDGTLYILRTAQPPAVKPGGNPKFKRGKSNKLAKKRRKTKAQRKSR